MEVILEIIIVALAGIPSSAILLLFFFFCSLHPFIFSSCFPEVLQSCPALCQKHQIHILGLLLLTVLLSFSQIYCHKILQITWDLQTIGSHVTLLLNQLRFNQWSSKRVLHTTSQSENFLSPNVS